LVAQLGSPTSDYLKNLIKTSTLPLNELYALVEQTIDNLYNGNVPDVPVYFGDVDILETFISRGRMDTECIVPYMRRI
jgi:hypothetical protein